MAPTPTPEQMQDAHKLSVMVYGEGLSEIEKRTAIFLATRDAAIVKQYQEAASIAERVATIQAHRACVGNEHDGMGKLHGNCVVCLVPFPCEYVGNPPTPGPEELR